jgi:plastocyanin
MNKKLLWLTSAPLAAIALCVTLGGCEQGIGGGVKSDVTVTLRSAELQIEETGSSDSDPVTNEPGSTDPSTGSGPGTFTGRVVFDGTPPSFPLLIAKGADVKDKQFCAADDLPNEKLVVDPSGGVANVFIFLDEAPKGYKAPETPPEQYHFDQKYCRFLPHAFVVQTGQEIRITNSDGVTHNTNMGTKRQGAFNQTVNANDQNGSITKFEKAEKVPARISCEFHNWMEAYFLILDHPFVAVSKPDGSFEIPNLPPGKYKFRVWHESADLLERGLSVTIKAGEVTSQDLKYNISKFSKL